MTREELYQSLDYINHSREKRAKMAALILHHPELIAALLDIAFTIHDPVSSRASWVMEFTAKEHLPHIFPYLDTFTENLQRVHLDSSVRPMAKICEYLMKAYFSKYDNTAQQALTETHLERITAACFDWLIGEQKVAVKAYSMTCLLLLGQKFDWIHRELRMVLERNYAEGSPAYKARARFTLGKIP